MLPWIFTVLILLNAGLFYWGYQREQSLEPPSTPVPEGRYEIRLLGEPSESPQKETESATDAAADSSEQDSGVSSPGEMQAEGMTAQGEEERITPPPDPPPTE